MMKTKVSQQKKSATQKNLGIENVRVSSASNVTSDNTDVKLEHLVDTAEVNGSITRGSAQLPTNVFHSTGNVGNLVDNITGGHIPLESVMSNDDNDDEPSMKRSALPSNHITGTAAPLMQMANMAEQMLPADNVHHAGSADYVCVFSTELANCAAESVRIGRYDNIIDFHHEYSAVPMSQGSRNINCFPRINCLTQYQQPSHMKDPAGVEEQSVSYVQADVEQWVRQQNASRLKQEQMAVSSVYPNRMYRTCDTAAESGQYQYWPGMHKVMFSVDAARPHMASSDDFSTAPGYGNVDCTVNVHNFPPEHGKVPDENLTVEQRQQRESKIGRLEVIRQMLTADHQQVPLSTGHMDHMMASNFSNSRAPPNVVPCNEDMYAHACNSGSQMMNSNYPSSAVGHHCQPANWNMMSPGRHKWYQLQPGHYVHNMEPRDNYYRYQPAELGDPNARYFGPHTQARSTGHACPLSLKDRMMMPAHGACDCGPVYPMCDLPVCGCMSSHISSPRVQPTGIYGGYRDVGMQMNYGHHQQVNACGDFINGRHRMPVGSNRQPLTYNVLCKRRADSMQTWDSGEDIIKQRLLSARVPQQFGIENRDLAVSRQQVTAYSTNITVDGNVVSEPLNSVVSCTQVPVTNVAVRQRLFTSKKKKSNSAARLADSKSKKLDFGAGEHSSTASVSKSSSLMNITSASLAHLAKGVENISAVMQQTVQQGGPFQSLQVTSDRSDGADENANFIPDGNSLQNPPTSMVSSVESKLASGYNCTSSADMTVHGSVAPAVTSYQTSGIYSGSSTSGLNCIPSCTPPTSVDVVVISKASYTISYHPTGVLSQGGAQDNVDASTVDSTTVQTPSSQLPVSSTCMVLPYGSTPTANNYLSNQNYPHYSCDMELQTQIDVNSGNNMEHLGQLGANVDQQISYGMITPEGFDAQSVYGPGAGTLVKFGHEAVRGRRISRDKSASYEGGMSVVSGSVTRPYMYNNMFDSGNHAGTVKLGQTAEECTGNASIAGFSHNVRMMQPASIAYPTSITDTFSSSHRHMPSTEGFTQQDLCVVTCSNNTANVGKVDMQAVAAGMCLSAGNSVAMVRPQMMAGTQLFITDRAAEPRPVFNSFGLPNSMSSTAFRSSPCVQSVQHDQNYRGFTGQHSAALASMPSMAGLNSPPNAMKLAMDPLHSSVYAADGVKCPSDSP